MGGSQRVVVGAWVAMLGLATVRSVADPAGGKLPPPSSFLAIGVLFTLLYGLGSVAPQLAAALAVGADVGALAAPYIRGKGPNPIQQLTAFLDTISGTPAAQAPSTPPLPSSQT